MFVIGGLRSSMLHELFSMSFENCCETPLVLHFQIHQLSRRHHVVVQSFRDQTRSDDCQRDDQHRQRQRQVQ